MTPRVLTLLTLAALTSCDRSQAKSPEPPVETGAPPTVQATEAAEARDPSPATAPRKRRTYLDAPVHEPKCAADSQEQGVARTTDNLHPAFDADAERVAARDAAAETVFTESPWRDGLARARFEVHQKLNATLLLRASKDGRDGVGVRISGGSVHWVRLVDGKLRPLEAEQPVYRFERIRELEIVALALGPDLVAQVHDARSGGEYMSLHALDPNPTEGRVGVRFDRDNPKKTRLALLSERDACSQKAADVADKDPVARYFVASPDKVKALPAADRALAREREDRDDGTKIYQTTTFGLERAFCGGADPRDVAVEPAYKFVNDDYATYRALPPVRAERGFRTDLSAKSPAMITELLEAYHEEFPKLTRLHQIGTSREGRPVWALAIARDPKEDDPRPSLLLNGAHHGDEPFSTEIVVDAIQTLLASAGHDPEVDAWLERFVIWAVPQVNPDGAERYLEDSKWSGRKNGWDVDGDGVLAKREGVDLNRNYPFRWGSLGDDPLLTNPHGKWYRGPKPASEPEVRAMMALADRERFVASISYHTGTVCILAPYTVEDTPNPEPNEAWVIAEEMSAVMGRALDGREFKVRSKIYPVEGTDQDWFRYEHGTVAYLVESVSRTPDDACARKKALEPNRISWQTLLRRASTGPAIYGRVTDAEGKPVAAIVELREQKLENGEKWSARPRDGVFGRLLPSPGAYHLEVRHDGRTRTHRVEVADGPIEVELKL